MMIVPRLFYTERQMHFVGRHMWSGVEQYSVFGWRKETSFADRFDFHCKVCICNIPKTKL